MKGKFDEQSAKKNRERTNCERNPTEKKCENEDSKRKHTEKESKQRKTRDFPCDNNYLATTGISEIGCVIFLFYAKHDMISSVILLRFKPFFVPGMTCVRAE